MMPFLICTSGQLCALESLFLNMQAQCSIRDCKVGPGFKLAERSECRDEVLANVKLPQ